MNEKAIFNWSSGKDSALCLYKIMQSKQYDIMCLLTSINKQFQRISMHGVRVELLEAQAASIGLSLLKVEIPEMPTMEVYDNTMEKVLNDLKIEGATASIFGDIFLEDLRTYREERLSAINLKGIFPLWKIASEELVNEFIDLGFRAIITCVNEKYLDKSFVGRIIDKAFLKDLPPNVDPCGENGEFHSFVFDGPIFSKPIVFEKGEIVYRKYMPAKKETNSDNNYNNVADDIDNPYAHGFWYCDLLKQTIF